MSGHVALPLPSSNEPSKRKKKSNAATGVSAAGVRALGSQAIAFYFRAPVKAFFRTRVDYLAYARAINPRVQAQERWTLRLSTPALLAHAVRTHGWSFIPNHVFPPLLANVSVGAVTYTSYLTILGKLHSPTAQSVKRVYPPPSPKSTFVAGAAAGATSSIVAAAPDALSVRFRTTDMTSGRFKSMWSFGAHKLRAIGLRGVFAGWGLSCTKETLGYGLFFSTFEYVKAQMFQRFIAFCYGSLRSDVSPPTLLTVSKADTGSSGAAHRVVLTPHYVIEPFFLGLAGVSATFAQQTIVHPMSKVQDLHYRSLNSLDRSARLERAGTRVMKTHLNAYERTLVVCASNADKAGGWCCWLYRGFWWNTIRQVPSTAAGLVMFELVRKRYGYEADAVRIEEDGYDILLT